MFIVAGLVLTALTFTAAWPIWVYVLAASLITGGAFAVFEARTKWCAVRAMGFRTPI